MASELFDAGKASFFIEIENQGEGKELKKKKPSYVNEGACPICEVENWDPKTDRGLPVCDNPFVIKGESYK